MTLWAVNYFEYFEGGNYILYSYVVQAKSQDVAEGKIRKKHNVRENKPHGILSREVTLGEYDEYQTGINLT